MIEGEHTFGIDLSFFLSLSLLNSYLNIFP